MLINLFSKPLLGPSRNASQQRDRGVLRDYPANEPGRFSKIQDAVPNTFSLCLAFVTPFVGTCYPRNIYRKV